MILGLSIFRAPYISRTPNGEYYFTAITPDNVFHSIKADLYCHKQMRMDSGTKVIEIVIDPKKGMTGRIIRLTTLHRGKLNKDGMIGWEADEELLFVCSKGKWTPKLPTRLKECIDKYLSIGIDEKISKNRSYRVDKRD